MVHAIDRDDARGPPYRLVKIRIHNIMVILPASEGKTGRRGPSCTYIKMIGMKFSSSPDFPWHNTHAVRLQRTGMPKGYLLLRNLRTFMKVHIRVSTSVTGDDRYKFTFTDS